jgi:hypothetical protein
MQQSKTGNNAEPKGKPDPWAENIHFRNDRAVQLKLGQMHSKLTGNFVNYFHHMENQRQAVIDSARKEMELLKASGQSEKMQGRFEELTLILDEAESDLESRDLNAQAKTAMAVPAKNQPKQS